MRRVSRLVLDVLTASSLLLCVAVVGLWVRSERGQDVRAAATGRGARWIVSSRGQVGLFAMDVPAGPVGWRIDRRADHGDDMVARVGHILRGGKVCGVGRFQAGSARRPLVVFTNVGTVSFSAGEANRGGCPLDFRWLAAPHWAVAAAAAAGPAARAVGLLQRRLRRRGGRCPVCGYDLRATPGRCPECGRAADVAVDPRPPFQPAPEAGPDPAARTRSAAPRASD